MDYEFLVIPPILLNCSLLQFKLTITDAVMSDTATYICIASNSVGNDELPISTSVWVVSDLR